MKIYYLVCELSNVGVIPLGRTGEHLATSVTIDATEWQKEYPNGALALLVCNPNGVVYPAQVETNGYVLTWNVTRDETAIAGKGEIELNLSASGAVVKSARCATQIDAALSQNADNPPTGTPEWVSELLDSIDNIKDAGDTIEAAQTATNAATNAANAANAAAENAPHISVGGTWMTWDAESGKYVDTGVDATGPKGDPGTTPHIGDNGNWFIGDVDTGVKAQGPAGANGTGSGTVTGIQIGGETYEPDDTGVVELPEMGGDASIDDTTPSTNTTYSSNKIDALLNEQNQAKANKAGWEANKLIGTDANGNLVAQDPPEDDGGDADTLGGQEPGYYAKQEDVDHLFASSFINDNTVYTDTGFPTKPTSASNTVFNTPADGIFYFFATRGETAGNTIQVYILKPNGEAVAQFNFPAYYAYAVCSLTLPVKRGMIIKINTDKDGETWTIHEQKFYY